MPNAALRIKGRQSFPHTVPQRFPFTTVCPNGSHFNLFFLNCSYAVPQIRVWKLYHPWASLYREAEQLFCLSCLSNSFCSWETDKRLNPGCQSNVSRTGMCVKGISGIYFFFILLSWLWQDRKWADPHVGSSRVEESSQVRVCLCPLLLHLLLSLCDEHSNFLSEFPPSYRDRIRENEVFVLCTKCKEVPESS